jgi:hypothetical protein
VLESSTGADVELRVSQFPRIEITYLRTKSDWNQKLDRSAKIDSPAELDRSPTRINPGDYCGILAVLAFLEKCVPSTNRKPQ